MKLVFDGLSPKLVNKENEKKEMDQMLLTGITGLWFFWGSKI